jgi:pyruvate ferredoxin oxidoreductase gamma subunit
MTLDDHGYPVIDYDHCKGCMICSQVCPIHAIETVKEVHAW